MGSDHEHEQAEAIMRDFNYQIDKTRQQISSQTQRVDTLEHATVDLLESQANAHKRVQALSEGITREEERLQQRTRKLYAALQFEEPRPKPFDERTN